MKRRIFLLAAICATALGTPALAEKIPLSDLSSYLNAMKTAKGGFTQINDDGTIAQGMILIKRPGRIRFEYAPPDESLVIAGAGTVAIFDPKSNSRPEEYPLSRTPLSLILAENVNLNRSNMVVAHTDDGTATTVTVQDPENPEYGNIALKFTANPVQLRQWVITNDVGERTTVTLRDLETGVEIGARPFNITTEINVRGLND